MKLITYIKRKWIDFRCQVSDDEINAYIYKHGGVSSKNLATMPDGEGTVRINWAAIKTLLETRKRRMLYNAQLEKELPNKPKLDLKPKVFSFRKPEWGEFREEYWKGQDPHSIVGYILLSAKSILLTSRPVTKFTKREVLEKNYKTFGEAYKDMIRYNKDWNEEHIEFLGKYESTAALDLMLESLYSNKKVPKKIKAGAKKLVDIIKNNDTRGKRHSGNTNIQSKDNGGKKKISGKVGRAGRVLRSVRNIPRSRNKQLPKK